MKPDVAAVLAAMLRRGAHQPDRCGDCFDREVDQERKHMLEVDLWKARCDLTLEVLCLVLYGKIRLPTTLGIIDEYVQSRGEKGAQIRTALNLEAALLREEL